MRLMDRSLSVAAAYDESFKLPFGSLFFCKEIAVYILFHGLF